mmetsp:Transcript_3594/g.8202  ORF Transcript_3594/g.8202 Transcript_3594/m.8202 type:complete len:302 (-) Transcript_3594:114-1019(-)
MQTLNIRQLTFAPRRSSIDKMAPKEQANSLKVDDDSNTKQQVVSVPPPVLAEKIELVGDTGSSSTITTRSSECLSSSLPPSTREVKKLLRKIRDSQVEEQVEITLTLLAMMINTDENEKSAVDTAVQIIILLDGPGTVLMALKDWYATSERISAVAIPLLLKLSVLSDEKIRLFLANVGLPTLVAAGNTHRSNGAVTCGVIGILSVICEVKDDDVMRDIANDDCIDLCVHAMKTWENETFVQSCCCLYLTNIIASDPANKARLCEKEIGTLILAALEKYRHKKDKTVYLRAYRAMTLYIAE